MRICALCREEAGNGSYNAEQLRRYCLREKVMSNAGLTALGVSFIFVTNALGAALVFFFKEEVLEKVNTIFLGFASCAMAAPDVASG